MPEPAQEDGSKRAELRNELLTLHTRILLRMPLFQAALIGAIGWIVLPHVGWPLYFAWAGLAFGAECARAVSAYWAQGKLAASPPASLHRLFVALDALAGLATGLAAVLFIPHLPLLSEAILETTLYAVAGAGVAVAVSSKRLVAAYSSAVLICAASAWSAAHSQAALLVVALTALYWIFLITVSADSERLLRRSIEVRHQRDEALRQLEQRNLEMQQVAARAEHAALTRARVLAAVSHDLRQPLHALSAYSALLLANPTAESLQEAGYNIDTLVRSLGEILGELFDLSRLSTGGYRLQHEPFSLDRLIVGVCAEFAHVASTKGLALNTRIVPVQVIGDASAVGRIVRNLLDNALKYTERGQVSVTLAQVAGEAQLEVSDTGRGIAADEHQRIFEEFYRIEDRGEDSPQGVGLGLSIVKHLCQLMHARIELRSQPGEGTQFTVTLPSVHAGPSTAAMLRSIQLGRQSWQGARVYVVDDDAAVRASMRALLTLWGFQVHCAAEAGELSALLAECGRPALLLIDLRLPHGQDGALVAAQARATYGTFPILVVTGETAESSLRSAHERQLTVLQKPVPFDTLYAAVSDAIQPPR